MHWGFNLPPSRCFVSGKMVPYWSPGTTAASGSKPPKIPEEILLVLGGSILLENYETRRDRQKLSLPESKPLKKKVVGFSRSHAAMVNALARTHW